MKRVLLVLLSALLIISICPMRLFSITTSAEVASNTTEFAGGSGTENDPYLISTVDHLYNVRNYLNAHYEMINDIDLTEATAEGGLYDYNGYGWYPIGTFTGTFDGKGFEIIGMRTKPKYGNYGGYCNRGLFSTIDGGTVRNVGMHNGTINSNFFGYPYVGFIAGEILNGTIEKCYNTGDITLTDLNSTNTYGQSPYIGGIVGHAESSTISMCYNAGNISATARDDVNGWSSRDAYVGGICGFANEYSEIKNCYNTGDLYATRHWWSNNTYGGSSGIACGSDLYNSYNTGTAHYSIADFYDNLKYCYYKSGCATNATSDATALNESKLSSKQFFTGFDFENVWDMGGNPDYLYPELKCFFIDGTVKINGDVCYNETVSAAIEKLNHKNVEINYVWYVNDEVVAEGASYKITAEDIGNELRVEAVSSHKRHPGSVSSKSVIIKKGIQNEMPKASEVEAISDKMITVSTENNQEYSIDNTNWQRSGAFENLAPNKEYAIYTRMVENELYRPSKSYVAATVTTDRRPLSGVVNITGSSRYGDTLTADVSGVLPESAAYSYEWKSNGKVIGTNNTYTVAKEDIGKNITVSAKGTGDFIGTLTSAAVTATKTTVQLPNAPGIKETTNTTVKLVAKSGYEYSKDKNYWQDSPLFEGLFAATEYTFYQRVKETDTTFASKASNGIKVLTLKNSVPAPEKPVVENITNISVTLKKINGYEYSLDGLIWQSSNVFTNLSPNTKYSFCQRISENATDYVSPHSGYIIATTLKNSVSTPPAPTVEKATDSAITLTAINGYEYSKDGTTWQKSNIFSGLTVLQTYKFYQRVAETNTDYASHASTALSFKIKNIVLKPAAPVLKVKTNNSIEIVPALGYEYSIGKTRWSTVAVFKNLSPNTEYSIYCRIPETDTHYSSAVSDALIVTTLKNTVSAPVAPVLLERTKSSVSLVANSTYEYSKNGTSWQRSNIFEGLSPNTEYTFYQRVGETNTAYASDKSKAIKVYTLKNSVGAPSAPTVLTKTATSITLVKVNGYEYSKNGATWQKSNVFDGLKANTEYSFCQRVAETNTDYASAASSAVKVKTSKHTAAAANPVVAIHVTATTITFAPYTGYEYSKDGVTWQADNEFKGLSADTEYSFYQRIAETDDTYASKISPVLNIKTAEKSACSTKPAAPIIAECTTNSISLVAREGYEYSKNGISWQSGNTFSGLSANTSYTFYQRIAETDKEFASAKSMGTSAKTVKFVSGTTSSTNYNKLRTYINTYGATSADGNKALTYKVFSDGDLYSFFRIENKSTGIYFDLTITSDTSDGIESTMDFLLTDTSKYISVNFLMLYFDRGNCKDAVRDMKTIDRSTYSDSKTYTLSKRGTYISSDVFSDSFNSSLKLLCKYWDGYIYSQLIFGLKGLGFTSYTGFGSTACDTHSSYHIGGSEKRNAYSATCTTNGCTGDTYCSNCGIKKSSGSVITCIGHHTYTNDCDKTCNSCGEERRVEHTYSGACDHDCNICGIEREIPRHTYDNDCDTICNECGYERKAPHIFDDSKDLICNDCGYERPPYTLGDIDGVEGVTDADAEYMLMYTFFPEDYPVNQTCDFNGDGRVNDADAEHLLMFTFFPEDYPLH